MGRRYPSATDSPTDAGPLGNRPAPPRISPSLAVPVVGGTGIRIRIPVGLAALVYANSAAVPTDSLPVVLGVGPGNTATTINLGVGGVIYARAADGFGRVAIASPHLSALLVVDTGHAPSSISPGLPGGVGQSAPSGVLNGVVIFGSNGGTPQVENVAPNGDSYIRIHDGDGAAALYQSYVGGTGAPCTGVWRVAIKATATTFPTVNGNVLAGPSGESAAVIGTIYIWSYPVAKGTMYTVATGTVVDGVVS